MTVDIAMWDAAGVQSLFSGGQVEGGDKTAQRLMINLMETFGQVPARTAGSDFVRNLEYGSVAEQQVFMALAAGLYQAAQSTEVVQLTDDPAAEKIQSVKVLGLAISQANLAVSLSVRFQDGSTTPVTVPLDFMLEA